jgi:hypothetical protein
MAGYYNEAIVRVTIAGMIETKITSEERYSLHVMEIAKNLLLIIPFWSSNLIPDLTKANTPTLKLLGLIFRDVMIKKNHPGVLPDF